MKVIQAVPDSAEYQARIEERQDRLRDYLDNPRVVQSPEELEKLEQEIRALTEELAALITGRQIQHSLDSEQLQQAQSALKTEWPHRLHNHDLEGVWVRTASGYGSRPGTSGDKGTVQARGGIEASILGYACWEFTRAVPPDSPPR